MDGSGTGKTSRPPPPPRGRRKVTCRQSSPAARPPQIPAARLPGQLVGTADCAVRAAQSGATCDVTRTSRLVHSARSDAGGDIAARCPYQQTDATRTKAPSVRHLRLQCRSYGALVFGGSLSTEMPPRWG